MTRSRPTNSEKIREEISSGPMGFEEGEKITVVGLKKGVQYNFRNGTICGPFQDGRWPVLLVDSEKILRVKPKNIVRRCEVDDFSEKQKKQNEDKEEKMEEEKSELNDLKAEKALLSRTKLANITMKNLEFDTVLGVGSFSTVRKARVVETKTDLDGCFVAVKLVDRRKIDRGRDKKRNTLMVHRERESLTTLNDKKCPYINRLYACFETQRHYGFVLYWCQRRDICNIILEREDKRLTDKEAKKYMRCILDAISVMHSAGYAHRDLKPENIMLDIRNNPQIIDFGSSCELKDYEKPGDTSFVGTPQYMAPEAVKNEVVRRDVLDYWALGCCLHFFLTGNHLFDGPTEYLVMCKVEKGEVKVDSKCPKDAEVLIEALAQMDPKKRLGINGPDEVRKHSYLKP